MSPAESRHTPVMLEEVLAALKPRPGGRYIDGTVGAAGHAAAILRASAPDGQLLGLDRDPAAVATASQVLAEFGNRARLVVASFDAIVEEAQRAGFVPADGILLDLGLSSDQLADPARGFGFQVDGPLDMRYGPDRETTAADLVNGLPEAELADLLARYGDEPHSRRIARAIVANRPIQRSGQLAELIASTIGRSKGHLHPATKTFLALRLRVNEELTVLERALPRAIELLAGGGVLAVLAFHSAEDRIVKRLLNRAAQDCICPAELPECRCRHRATVRLVHRRALRPSIAERRVNPRARSARLRVAERLATPSLVEAEG